MAETTLPSLPRPRGLDLHLSDTGPRQFGRVILYISLFGAVVVIAFTGKNLVPVSLMLGLYIAFIIVARKPLWNRTPWPLPQPALILSLFWLFGFGISSLPKFFGTKPIHWDLAGHERYLYWALFLVMISNVLVVAGYLAVWPSKVGEERLRRHELQGSLSLVMVIALWLLSIASRVFLFGVGRFGYIGDLSRPESGFGQTLGLVYELAWLAIAALVVELLTSTDPSKRVKIWFVLGCISLVELSSVVVAGFKGYVVLTFAPAIAAMWGLRRRLPYKAVLGAAVIVVLISPGNFRYRDDVNAGKVARDDFLGAAQTAISYTIREFGANPIDSVVLVWNAATTQFADYLENTALILYKTPSLVPHRGAEWYFTAVPRAIFPRFIWRDKPVDDMASYMTVVYRGAVATTGSPPGFTGDLYMRTGVGGVIIGSLLTGVMLGVAIRVFSRNKKKYIFVAGAAALVSSISNTHLDSLFIYLIHRGILYSAAAWLMFFPIGGRRDEVGVVKAGV